MNGALKHGVLRHFGVQAGEDCPRARGHGGDQPVSLRRWAWGVKGVLGRVCWGVRFLFPTSGRLVVVKKLFVLLLVVILPLQFAWAGAGVYCQHEMGQAGQHFGHHDHQHKGLGDQGKSESGKFSPGADNDCSFHLNGHNCFLSSLGDLVVAPIVVFNGIRSRDFASHIPDGPERPDRQLAA